MKKKLLFIVSFLGALSSGITAQSLSGSDNFSELDLYNEINIYSNAKYFPGVIEQAELLEKYYPESVFIVSARIAKAHALTTLNRYEEAIDTLRQILSSIHFGSQEYAKSWYLLGKAYFYNQEYNKALNAFHTCCDVENREEKKESYSSAILYSGRIQFLLKDYEKSIPLFEYVVANGVDFSTDEYNEALQKLMFSYNAEKLYSKTTDLYTKLNPDSFDEKTYAALTIYAVDAYEKSGMVETAYETLNRNDNEDFQEMLASFRINLGIAAYNRKDYETALDYFSLGENTKNSNNQMAILVYRQKIKLDTKGVIACSEIEAVLNENKADLENCTLSGISDSYNSLLLRCNAFGKSPAPVTVLSYYNKIEAPAASDAYITAACVMTADKKQAEKILEPFVNDSDCATLYAQISAQNGKYAQAASVYANLKKSNLLDGKNLLEYAKVLYQQKKWSDAKAVALEANEGLSLYVAGLCDYNLKNYSNAYSYFRQYNSSKQTDAEYKRLSTYYWGVCAYKLGNYKEAGNIVDSYLKAYKGTGKEVYEAYEVGAKSALMTGNLKNAALMAEGMIQFAPSVQKKQDSVIFCGEIYTDAQEYKKARELLVPYTEEKSVFAVQCLFQIAKTYEKTNSLTEADEVYSKIAAVYPLTEYAERAMYRSGEVYYSAGKLEEAELRFTKYIYAFVNGRYSDAAYYYSGDCNMKTGDLNRAIMQNNTLVTKYPQSVYSYGAYKNLLDAYYAQESYADALTTARYLVRNYDKQAASDGIGQRIIELENIVSGTDRAIAEKTGEYERAGKTSSRKGRVAGSELVQLYAAYDYDDEAVALAEELLKYQLAEDESFYAAQNAYFAASYYREHGEDLKAAEKYLKAAEYFRLSGMDDSDNAAGALYSATEAFVAAGLKGDAEVTAKLLVELYPSTKQGQKVLKLIE